MDSAKLSAIGLGNMIMNMVPYAIMMGVNTALETLVSQAFGRNNLQDCGTYLHRACFVISILFIPVCASFFYMSELFNAAGMDANVAGYTETYLTTLLPAVLINCLGDSIDIFLVSMGFSNVVCLIQIAVLPIHILQTWLLVCYFDLGIVGAAISNDITSVLNLGLQLAYVSSLTQIRDAWFFPSRRTFDNLWPFMKLVLPGILMLFLENLNMEILVLLAGMFKDIEMMAA